MTVTGERISFVGLGHMGGPMSRRLAEAGLDLTVFDLDPARAAPALARGARLAASAAESARGATVLITMLPTPGAVEDVMLGAGRALSALPAGALWIDMSTSSPDVAERVRARGAQNGLRALDAPVAGMSAGAEAGTLEIFVGGAAADVAQARPILEHLGDPERIFHVGGNGAGYVVKLMLNLLWFDQLVAVAEVLAIGTRAGVDLEVLHRSLVEGPTASRLLARDLLPLLRDGEYEEGFSMALATKDLRLAVDLARAAGVPAELSAVVERLFTRARAVYGDEAGEMTPVRLYEEAAGVLLRLPAAGARPADPRPGRQTPDESAGELAA
ncbi:MAG: NAD(P)-dependent oxidoreductase [Deltaproteobacteria bacterium]